MFKTKLIDFEIKLIDLKGLQNGLFSTEINIYNIDSKRCGKHKDAIKDVGKLSLSALCISVIKL